jgi:ribulose-phosphate 3-epimerase
MNVGVAINPHTSVDHLIDIIRDIDLVCLMSVNPGFGGQQFIPYSMEKIKQLRKMINDTGATAKIEVGGGVTLQNAKQVIEAGADVLVAGNAVFTAPNPTEAIATLKAL